MKRKYNESCVVCGKPFYAYTGYIFYEDGTTETGAPWCREHGEAMNLANPIFENEKALELFKSKHPILFKKHVEGRKIIYLQSWR